MFLRGLVIPFSLKRKIYWNVATTQNNLCGVPVNSLFLPSCIFLGPLYDRVWCSSGCPVVSSISPNLVLSVEALNADVTADEWSRLLNAPWMVCPLSAHFPLPHCHVPMLDSSALNWSCEGKHWGLDSISSEFSTLSKKKREARNPPGLVGKGKRCVCWEGGGVDEITLRAERWSIGGCLFISFIVVCIC